MVGGPGFEPGGLTVPNRCSARFGTCRQRPSGFGSSRASVRRVPLRDGGRRPGCYMRCYTISAAPVPAARTMGTSSGAKVRDRTRRSFYTPQAGPARRGSTGCGCGGRRQDANPSPAEHPRPPRHRSMRRDGSGIFTASAVLRVRHPPTVCGVLSGASELASMQLRHVAPARSGSNGVGGQKSICTTSSDFCPPTPPCLYCPNYFASRGGDLGPG